MLRAVELEGLVAPLEAPPRPEYHEDTAPPLPSDWDAGDEGREVEFKRLNAAEAPVRAIYKHVKVHCNAFLNSDGGTLMFGVSDRGRVLGLSLGPRDRDVIRTGIDQIFMNFYPRADPLLYHISYRRVIPPPASPSKAATIYTPQDAERFVLMIQVRRGLAPIYFVSTACEEAYIRGSAASLTASKAMVNQRLCFGKPPPLTFAGLASPLLAAPPALLRAFGAEWERVYAALVSHLDAPPVLYIEGGPLSGKTSLAGKLAAELAPVFGEGLLELDWAKEAQPLSKWQKFEGRLQATPALPATGKTDVDQGRYDARAKEAREADTPAQSQTSYWHTRRYVIILENVPAADMIRSVLRRRPRSSLLLVTSARRLALDVECGAVPLVLGPWSAQRREEALKAVAPHAPPPLVAALAAHAPEQPGLVLAVAPLLARCPDVAPMQVAAAGVARDAVARRFSPLTGVRRLLLSLALLALPVSVRDAALLWDVPAAVAAAILHIWSDHYGLLRPAAAASAEGRVVVAQVVLLAASAVQPTEQDALFIEGALRTKSPLTPIAAAWAVALGRPALAWLALARCMRP